MFTKPQPPRIPLPKGWRGYVKSAMIVSWVKRIDQRGPDALLQHREPVIYRCSDIGGVCWSRLEVSPFIAPPCCRGANLVVLVLRGLPISTGLFRHMAVRSQRQGTGGLGQLLIIQSGCRPVCIIYWVFTGLCLAEDL